MNRFFSPVVLLALLCPLLTVRTTAQLTTRAGVDVQLRAHQVEALVEDGLARTTLRQVFVNREAQPLEAVYRFPLPEDAALVSVVLEAGGQRLEGLLAERKRARAVYDEIVRARRDPALVEQVGSNEFRLSVFPVVPNEETIVELTWTQRVPLEHGTFAYVLPLGLGETAPARDLTVSVTLRSSAPLAELGASRDDVYVVRRSPNEVNYSLEQAGSTLSGEVVVSAAVVSDEPDLRVRAFHDGGEEGWFLALLTPPRARAEELLPRDVVLVVDTSGSMEPENKLEQAQRSARWLIAGLRPADRVNIVRFSSDVQAFAPGPVPLDAESRTRLLAFVDGFTAEGSTAFGDALELALATPRVQGRVQTLVFLTDGRPTIGEQDRAELIARARAGGEAGLRLFTFGVGADLDGALLRGIASAGRGSAELFRPGVELEARLSAFLARTAAPVIADVELRVAGLEGGLAGGLAGSPAVRDVHPRPVPEGYLGGQIALVGRYSGSGPARVSVAGLVKGERRVLTRDVELPHAAPGATSGQESVKHLFARQKLDRLEEALRLRTGLDDAAYYAALDRGAYATEGELVQELIDVSLGHGVQCAYTSFLVLLPEDRARLNPRTLEGLTAALERVNALRPGASRSGPLGLDQVPEEEVLEESVLMDADGDPDFLTDSPFDSGRLNDVIGIGGGAGGKFGGRFDGRGSLRAAVFGHPTGIALQRGLTRLASAQRVDGLWSDQAGASERALVDTAWALSALLGDGNTTRQGAFRSELARGVQALLAARPGTSATFEADGAPVSLHAHALITHVLVESYYFSKSPVLKRRGQQALTHLVERLPTSLEGLRAEHAAFAGWVVLTLFTADEAGMTVPADARSAFLALLQGSTGADTSPAHWAAALLAAELFEGADGVSPGAVDWAPRLASATRAGAADVGLETLFLASSALALAGDEPFRSWKQAVFPRLLSELQAEDPPATAAAGAATLTRTAGTALRLLCLQAETRISR